MNYIYAAMLLHSAGKAINEENLKKVISATGEQADDSRVKALVSALEGVNIEEAIAKAAMPVAVAAGPVATTGDATTKAEESEAEKEKAAEAATEGLGSLFG